MSVYIKGMEMPKPGQIVLVEMNENGDVFAAYDGGRTKLSQYKAVPVPDHGDLIDRNALEERVITQKYACARASASGSITELHKSWGLHDAELMIEAAPTIIPADKEGTAQ